MKVRIICTQPDPERVIAGYMKLFEDAAGALAASFMKRAREGRMDGWSVGPDGALYQSGDERPVGAESVRRWALNYTLDNWRDVLGRLLGAEPAVDTREA